MAWPTHENHFQSTFNSPTNVKRCVWIRSKTIRFWYDNAGFGRLVEVVDMEDLWDLEKKPFKTGKLHGLADSRGRFSVHMSSSAGVKRCVWILYIYIRFWYDNAGFGRLVQGVDKEDLWGLEKKTFRTGKQHGLADSRGPFSNRVSSSADVKRCVWLH